MTEDAGAMGGRVDGATSGDRCTVVGSADGLGDGCTVVGSADGPSDCCTVVVSVDGLDDCCTVGCTGIDDGADIER